jgi:type I protein arginine methyltransferase
VTQNAHALRATEDAAAAPPPPATVEELLDPVDKLIDEGRFDIGYALLKRLRLVLGQHEQLTRRLGRIYRAWVPRWHFSMLNDRARNGAFAEAIARSNLRDKVVLDIGAGSGLLSMLAAKHGAAHVYACEMIAPVADKAVEIIAANGYADRVTLIPKISYDVRIGADMPRRADVLLSETIDCGFVGEGFLGALRHARAELLQPDAALVPRSFALEGALLESDDVFRLNRTDDVEGFSLTGFNELSTQGYFPVRLDTWRHRLMSSPRRLLALDLAAYTFEPITETIVLTATAGGQVHGVVFWFDAELVPGVTISNSPGGNTSHWMQAFACFEQPITVANGDDVTVQLTFSQRSVDLTYLRNGAAARRPTHTGT